MKGIIAFALVAVVLALVDAQAENCRGECYSSTECATQSGSLQCRCSYFTCKMIEGNCGGGCLSDSQCQDWAQGDPTCVCSLGQCSRESDRKYPGYQEFLKQVHLAKAKARASAEGSQNKA